MSDNVENIYLRGLRDIMGELGILRRDMGDVKMRLSSIERGLGEVQTQLGVMNGRMDHMDSRLEKLEKNVGLSDTFLGEDMDPFRGPEE